MGNDLIRDRINFLGSELEKLSFQIIATDAFDITYHQNINKYTKYKNERDSLLDIKLKTNGHE
jgi:hypothetical protein